MKRQLFLAFLLVSQLLLGGCAYLSSYSADLPDKIDTLIQQQEYGEALQLLEYARPSHAEYNRLMQQKKRIEKLVPKYERQTIQKADKLTRQGQWHQAQLTYDKALKNLPQSDNLQKAQQEFLTKRDNYLKQLELSLLLNRANWLIKNAPTQKEIVRVLPNDYKRYDELRNYPDMVDEAADQLVDCVQSALDAGNYNLAETCLKLAESIGSKNIDKKQLAVAKKKLAKARNTEVKRQNDITRALIAELKQGYSQDNLKRARHQLNVLKKQNSRNRTSIKLRKELNKRYRQGIDQKITAGRRLYSSGKIQEALDVWHSLLKIDPDNQKLQGHIDRAERVLEKLERLSNEGAVVQPPKL
jgi:tetratricopeptide (TPR) repeat protein